MVKSQFNFRNIFLHNFDAQDAFSHTSINWNEFPCCCLAGLLRCGETGVQRGRWQTLRKPNHAVVSSHYQWNCSALPPTATALLCIFNRSLLSHTAALQDLSRAIDFFFLLLLPSPRCSTLTLIEPNFISCAASGMKKKKADFCCYLRCSQDLMFVRTVLLHWGQLMRSTGWHDVSLISSRFRNNWIKAKTWLSCNQRFSEMTRCLIV